MEEGLWLVPWQGVRNPRGVIRLLLTLMIGLARLVFRSPLELTMENLARRQQLAVFKQKRSRPRMGPGDRMFWVFLWMSLKAIP